MSRVSFGVFTDISGRRFVLVAEDAFSALRPLEPILTAAEATGTAEVKPEPTKPPPEKASPTIDEDDFGKRIFELRNAKMPELTQEKLCELSGVTQATISHVETGATKARKSTRTRLLQAIADYEPSVPVSI
jgi:DNA-binding XRE family transcriptional regulator